MPALFRASCLGIFRALPLHNKKSLQINNPPSPFPVLSPVHHPLSDGSLGAGPTEPEPRQLLHSSRAEGKGIRRWNTTKQSPKAMRTSLSPSLPLSIHHPGGRELAASPGRVCPASLSLLPAPPPCHPRPCLLHLSCDPSFLPCKWGAAEGRAGRAAMLRLAPGWKLKEELFQCLMDSSLANLWCLSCG